MIQVCTNNLYDMYTVVQIFEDDDDGGMKTTRRSNLLGGIELHQ